MWIPQPTGQALVHLRQQCSLTQNQLAKKARIPQSRISQLELGTRTPTLTELERLGGVLNLAKYQIRELEKSAPAPGLRELLTKFRRERPPQKVIPVYKRLASLREKYGALFDQIEFKFCSRQDEASCRQWLGHIPTDSCDELIPWMKIVGEVDHAVGRYLSLEQIDFDTFAVADTDTGRDLKSETRPCLELALPGDAVALLFPQVPLRTLSYHARVDILVELVAPRKRLTCIIEVDGLGHISAFDKRRSKALGLPILRFTPEELLAGHWVSKTLANLTNIIQNGPDTSRR